MHINHSFRDFLYIFPAQPWFGFCSVCSAKPCHRCLGSRFYYEMHKNKKVSDFLRLLVERKTRLELATPTLARLCSTNWAISAVLRFSLFKPFLLPRLEYIILLGQGCALPTELFPHYLELCKPFYPFCECKYRANIFTVQEIYKKFAFLIYFLAKMPYNNTAASPKTTKIPT